MSRIEVEFKFEIGEIVYFRDSCHNDRSRPKKFCIVERVAQQCHGGVQQLYKFSNVDAWVSEVGLTRDKPAYEPKPLEAYKQELARHHLARADWRHVLDEEVRKASDED